MIKKEKKKKRKFWLNQIFFCYSDLRCKRRWRGLKEMLICSVISSPFLLNLSPLPTAYPGRFTLFLLKLGRNWKLLCDCQRWQISCPPVCLFILCKRPYEGLSWGLYWAAVKHAGRMWSHSQLWLWGVFVQRGQKKKKKILVVSNLICFHGSVFMARAAKQLAIADCSCAVVKPYNMMTKPTNRMEDGRRNMHCTVMYWNILHEASIPTIKVETSTLSLLFVKQF